MRPSPPCSCLLYTSNLCYEISDRDGAEEMRAAVKENVDFIRYAQQDDTDMIKGMMGMVVGLVFKKIRFLFPPIVTGSVVLTIGISLYDLSLIHI